MEYVYFSIGSPERGGNHSLTSKCRFKNPKIHDLSLSSKALSVAFMFPLFLADLDMKYGNEIEMDEK